MKKIIWKIRGFFIKLLAGNDINVIINTNLDSNKGIIISSKYNVFKNIEIEGFNTAFTMKDKKCN